MMTHGKLDDRLNEFAMCERFAKVCHFFQQHAFVQDSFHKGLEFTTLLAHPFLKFEDFFAHLKTEVEIFAAESAFFAEK